MREEYGYSFKSAIENSQITEVNEGNHANFSGKWQLTLSLIAGSGREWWRLWFTRELVANILG